MTTTPIATPALPLPRSREQVIYLPTTPDLQRRPAGAHQIPTADLLDDDAYWDAEAEAFFTGAAHTRPLEQHGHHCSCCRAVTQCDEAAS